MKQLASAERIKMYCVETADGSCISSDICDLISYLEEIKENGLEITGLKLMYLSDAEYQRLPERD